LIITIFGSWRKNTKEAMRLIQFSPMSLIVGKMSKPGVPNE